MKQRVAACLLTAFAALAMGPSPANAWGVTGHATVAIIAQNRLTPAVLEEIQGLLALEGYTEMWRVASWADHNRAPGMPVDPDEPVHSARIPFSGDAPAHACPGTTALCADEAVDHYTAVLADRSLAASVRLEALKYVIHMVGDLHQPLHGSDPIGYNQVSYKDSVTIIHSIWDNQVVTEHTTNGYNLAAELSANGVAVTLGGTPRDWAVESSDMARDHIYDVLPVCWSACPTTPTVLPNSYAADKYPLAAQRLKQAGYRLGDLLNATLTP